MPSEARLREEIAPHRLTIDGIRRFGQDYARTLHLWASQFQAADSGMNEPFDRQWLFYLAYCEAGFSTGRTNVIHIGLSRDD